MPVDPLTIRADKGAPLTATEMDDNLKKLRDFANSQEAVMGVSLNADGTLKTGAVTLASIADGLITAAKLAADATYFQPGDIKMTARTDTPAGWLECNGQAVDRNTYAALFSAISTTYGIGDSPTTFNVPDFRGRCVLGEGTGSGLTARSRGQLVGSETHTLVTAEIPSHTHGYSAPSTQTGDSNAGANTVKVIDTGAVTAATGGGGAHNNMQPSAVARYLIKT